MVRIILSFIFGTITGVFLMCLLQINRWEEKDND